MAATVATIDDGLLFDLESTCLLSAVEGKPRRPLLVVARELLDEFEAFRSGEKSAEGPNAVPSNLIYFYNMGSLIQYHRGELQKAEEVCSRAIAICREMLEENRSAHWGSEMLQPLINLGRIEAARADLQTSLSIFNSVYQYVFGSRDLTIDGYRLSSNLVPTFLERETKLQEIARTVYLTDSIRAYLFAEDYSGLLCFLEPLASSSQYQDQFFTKRIIEAKARSLIALKQTRRALELLSTFLRLDPASAWKNIGLYCLVGNIYSVSGRPDDARKVLGMIEKCVDFVTAIPAHESAATAHIIYYAALTAWQAGNVQLTASLAKRSLSICEKAGHEVGTLKALCLLLKIATRDPLALNETTVGVLYERLLVATLECSYGIEKAIALHELAMFAPSNNGFDGTRKALLLRAGEILRENQARPPIRRRLLAGLRKDGGPERLEKDATDEAGDALLDGLYRRLLNYSPLAQS